MTETLIIYCALMTVAAIAAYFRPAVAVGVFYCTFGLVLWTESQNIWFYFNHYYLNLASGCLLLLALVRTWTRRDGGRAGIPTVTWYAYALYIFCALSITWSLDPVSAVDQWQRNLNVTICYAILAPLLIGSFADAKNAAIGLILWGAVIAILLVTTGNLHNRTITLPQAVYEVGRTGQTGRNTGVGILALASFGCDLALAAALLNFKAMRWIWVVARWGIVLLGLGLAALAARGQFFGAVIAVVICLPISRRVRGWGIPALILSVVILAAATYFAFDTFADTSRYQDRALEEAYSGRIDMVLTALRYWIGSDSIFAYIFGLGTSACFSDRIIGFYPHFVPGEVLVEEGVFGLILFGSVIFLTARTIWRTSRLVAADPVKRGVLATWAALFILNFILCLKQGSLLGCQELFGTAIIIGRLQLSSIDPVVEEAPLVTTDEFEDHALEYSPF